MIRKRVVLAVLMGVMMVLSGIMLSAGAFVYYSGFLDGSKRCEAGTLK
jgi:hypothetical protein|tara:strand:+ start:91 stop:234 length:144 start_codon:yes stop_codon:yes gene_type:complete